MEWIEKVELGPCVLEQSPKIHEQVRDCAPKRPYLRRYHVPRLGLQTIICQPLYHSYKKFLVSSHLKLNLCGPTAHRCERTGPEEMGKEELAQPLTCGSSPSGHQAHILGLGLAHLTSTTSMACWSSWRAWSCGMISAGSPWLRVAAGCQRQVSVRAQWWWCARNQRPWTGAVTHCNEHLQARLIGQKDI